MAKKTNAISNFEGFDFGNEGNPTEYIPTGHVELDHIIANVEANKVAEDGTIITGGLPTGKLVMIYGGEGGGKSSLAYSICGSAQRMGKVPIWIDVENSFSESLAKINGVDLSKIGRKSMYDKNNPDQVFDGETALDCVIDACKKGAGVVVLDSIASLVPRYVMENPADKDTMAALARLLGKTVNKICSFAAANNTLVIFINQLRVNPGATFKDPEGFPGGKAIAHACSVILKLNKKTAKDSYTYIEDDDGNDKLISGMANIFIQKNRFAPPHFGGIAIPIRYEHYFPQVEETAFDFGRQTKLITVRNGVFSWGGIKAEGKKAFVAELIAKEKVGELIKQIKEVAEENKVILDASILNYERHVAFTAKNKDKLEMSKKKAKIQKDAAANEKADELDELLGEGENEDSVASFGDNPEL